MKRGEVITRSHSKNHGIEEMEALLSGHDRAKEREEWARAAEQWAGMEELLSDHDWARELEAWARAAEPCERRAMTEVQWDGFALDPVGKAAQAALAGSALLDGLLEAALRRAHMDEQRKNSQAGLRDEMDEARVIKNQNASAALIGSMLGAEALGLETTGDGARSATLLALEIGLGLDSIEERYWSKMLSALSSMGVGAQAFETWHARAFSGAISTKLPNMLEGVGDALCAKMLASELQADVPVSSRSRALSL